MFALVSYLFVQRGLGFQALPIAASIAAIFLAVLMFWTVDKGVCKLDLASIGTTAAKSLVAGAAASGFAWGALQFTPAFTGRFHNFGLLLVLLLVLTCAAWVYYFAAKLLKMPETETVSRAMRRGR